VRSGGISPATYGRFTRYYSLEKWNKVQVDLGIRGCAGEARQGDHGDVVLFELLLPSLHGRCRCRCSKASPVRVVNSAMWSMRGSMVCAATSYVSCLGVYEGLRMAGEEQSSATAAVASTESRSLSSIHGVHLVIFRPGEAHWNQSVIFQSGRMAKMFNY
jgi:hypothetical protein